MDDEKTRLKRVITFWPLAFYGLGVIVGAGIYVAIGAVIDRAGASAPLAFLVAGIVALLTGLCYAKLGARFPEAAGAAAYVERGFHSRFAGQLVGIATTVAAIIAAASIAAGAVRYLQEVVTLPAPILLTFLIGGFALIAASGVRNSVWLAAAVGMVEIGGLLAAIAAGLLQAPAFDIGVFAFSSSAGLLGVLGGAYVAFFAFIGFETIANVAEEIVEPQRDLPRAITFAVVVSISIYVAVCIVAVLNDAGGEVPLLQLFEGKGATVFALVGAVAISNGVLVEIVMLSRLFYGMARRRQLPGAFAVVGERTRTPLLATWTAGALILGSALALPFENLLLVANALTLLIFVAVDCALYRIESGEKAPAVRLVVPVLGAASSAGLLMLQWLPRLFP